MITMIRMMPKKAKMRMNKGVNRFNSCSTFHTVFDKFINIMTDIKKDVLDWHQMKHVRKYK
jgi:hypothetical protein